MVTKFLPLRGGCKGFLCNILQCLMSLNLFQKYVGVFSPKGIEKYKLINLKFRFGDPKH